MNLHDQINTRPGIGDDGAGRDLVLSFRDGGFDDHVGGFRQQGDGQAVNTVRTNKTRGCQYVRSGWIMKLRNIQIFKT
jgi:hypothetical protein